MWLYRFIVEWFANNNSSINETVYKKLLAKKVFNCDFILVSKKDHKTSAKYIKCAK